MRFLVDTNILISASVFPGGKVAYVFAHILEAHTLVVSSYSLTECRTVFDRKFQDKKHVLEAFLEETEYELYETPVSLVQADFPYVRDEKDLPILASAILSEVDILLTGDKDFQDIPLKKPLLFTPSKYFELIKD